MRSICRWLVGLANTVCTPPTKECAAWSAVAQTICDVTENVAQTICDATTTVMQTICDATTTVMQTVCDATTTVTNSVCDSFGSIPIIGGLICLISHIVSTVVCAVSHVVSTVVCTLSHVVSTIVCTASHIVASVICLASHVVAGGLCILWTIIKAGGCVLVGGAAKLVCFVSSFTLHPGPIIRSTIREVPSVARVSASARSFILATDLRSADLRSPYDEEGMHVEYRLEAGNVQWAIGPAAPFVSLDFVPAELPLFAKPPAPGTLSASYNRVRLGDWQRPPDLDMIAASSDRAIAKRQGTDQVFLCVVGNPYVHPVGQRRLVLPQSFFKLDPELGQTGVMPADLVAHVQIPGDDERHPATERFPLFRILFTLGTVRVRMSFLFAGVFRLLRLDFTVKLFNGAGDVGLTEEMDVQVAPRVWHEIDIRPPRKSNEPPSRFPTYEHVVYDSNDPSAPMLVRHSIAYERVLDLGVGLSHLHEQHDNRFGGEIDNLSDVPWTLFGVITLPESDESAYRFANGPIRDYGGWVDGTCIYYMLVQLKPAEQIDERNPATLADAYAVLWTDEQSFFCERWRALDLDDREFNSPFKPIVGLVTKSSSQFYPESPFDATRFWSPLRAGHVIAKSRMAVVRQVVVLTGRDPSTNQYELYSIHFSWPTMDRTWRWRSLPPAAVRFTDDAPPAPEGDVVLADTLRMREDTTILLRGTRVIGETITSGWWFQRYLPADGQETPSVAALTATTAGAKPATGYSHPWAFVSGEVFTEIDEAFSHFGVYEPVHSRVQLYRVTLVSHGDLSDGDIEAAIWEDTHHAFTISREQLDWAAAANALNGTGRLSKAVAKLTHPSRYNDPMSFKVGWRAGLGWILLHFDKRDDNLLPFDGVGTPLLQSVTLTNRDDPTSTISISVDAHSRNNVRKLHGRTVEEETDAVSPPQVLSASVSSMLAADGSVASVTISLELARGPSAMNAYADFATWVAMNVWRVKLGAVLPGQTTPAVTLCDLVREGTFTANTPTSFSGVWTPTPGDQRSGLLAELLTEHGRVRYGTSVWFVGATGMACCADETTFMQVSG